MAHLGQPQRTSWLDYITKECPGDDTLSSSLEEKERLCTFSSLQDYCTHNNEWNC